MRFYKRKKSKQYIIEQALKKIKTEELGDLFDTRKRIILENFTTREGNVSPYELQAISLIIANISPKTLLEIGTFDGTTTLQMALNSPQDSVVHTLDLPDEATETLLPSLGHDMAYIFDTKKKHRKFKTTSVHHKIVQHFGDSASYDFKKISKERTLDFCFIDGGHSYEIVKNDTEKVIPLLRGGGGDLLA